MGAGAERLRARLRGGQPLAPVLGGYRLVQLPFAHERWTATMHLDPSMSRGDVATLYAEAIHTLPDTRQRPLSDRILPAGRIPHSGRRSLPPWSALRSDWNRAYPDWRYHWEVPMSCDYRRALRKSPLTKRYQLLGE